MSRRLLSCLVAVAVFLLAALFGLSALAAADDGDGLTPLSAEPAPLDASDSTAAVFQQVPESCTVLTTGLCLETVNTWSCPQGLSEDAKNRLAPSYNEFINNPPPVALAYLDTHCIFEQATRITPATWARLTGTPVAPDAYIDSAGNVCRNIRNSTGDVVRIECESPGATPAPTPIAVPVPSFTA